MFALAISFGILAYLYFCVGLVGLLYQPVIIGVTLLFLGLLLIFYYKKQHILPLSVIFNSSREAKLILWVIVGELLINLIGALGPELAFDALWYHLTIPKLFLLYHKVMHIPGTLLHYADFPKVVEMLYLLPLSYGSEIGAKLIHFGFGILTLFALYRLALKFFDQKVALLVVLIFSSNLVFMWESITALNDLGRTFFEVMALWGFVEWVYERNRKWLYLTAIMVGLAITTKLIAVASLIIYCVLILIAYVKRNELGKVLPDIAYFILIALLVPFPWFIFSFIHTGNPVYPLFTPQYDSRIPLSLFNPIVFIHDLFVLFVKNPDPINPLYVLVLPLLVVLYKKFSSPMRLLIMYSVLSLFFWYIMPQTGGGRFILPYLPAWSLLVGEVYTHIQDRFIAFERFRLYPLHIIFFVACISMIYRGVANAKYVPVVFGIESKSHFLTKHLNFQFGDFYDTDGFFKAQLTKNDTVLLYGFHNLYYVDFPYIDTSWVEKGNKFTYIAVQEGVLPKRFQYWNLVHFNPKTNVRVYSLGGVPWDY